MSTLPIVRWPDSRLREKCEDVGGVTPDIQALAADMLRTMYAAPGRGLAGPQVGAMIRLFVMDEGWKEGTPTPVVMVDPVIEWASPDQVLMEEGCLSIPGISVDVLRPVQVRMRWTDLEGGTHNQMLTGAAARIAQHEFDHLNGIVTFDRLAPDARAQAEREYAA